MSAGLYAEIMGSSFAALPQSLRQIHRDGSHDAAGRCDVASGGALARLIGKGMGLPCPGTNLAISIRFEKTGSGEIWRRSFAGRKMVTHLRAGSGRRQGMLIERIGLFAFAARLVGDVDGLQLRLAGWTIGILPLPRWLMPRVRAREFDDNGKFAFDIAITLPLVGPLLTYRGWLEAVASR